MSKEVSEAQSHIDGLLVAKMYMDFYREFRDIYQGDVMMWLGAVGPMQSFLGAAINNGYIVLAKEHRDE